MTPDETRRALDAGKESAFWLDDAGLTLRDYFAAAVLPSLMQYAPDLEPHEFAGDAYRIADAMLIERAKPREPRP